MNTVASHFLQDLAVVLSLAGLVTVVFNRLRLPVVAGYLVAGVVLGPGFGVGLIQDPETVRTLAEIGVILLMMFIGMEFRFRTLIRIGPRVGLAVLIETGLMMVLGYAVANSLGWNRLESLLAAGVVAISSTAVIAKALQGESSRSPVRNLVFSLLVFEDLVAIVLVAVGTTMAIGGAVELGAIGQLLGRMALLLLVLIVVGMTVVPTAVRAIVAAGRTETILITTVGLTFLLAVVTHRAGYSVALGAFLAGVLIAESGASHQVEEVVRPVRDLFAAVFFVAVGMLLDVRAAAEAWPLIALFTVVVVVGKIVGVTVGAFLAGFPTRTAVRSGLSMAQIGEFSFILAGLEIGASSGAPLYSIAVATAIVTAFLTPPLVRRSEAVALWVDRRLPKRIQTFASLYGAWLDTLSAQRGPVSPWRAGRRLIWLMVVDAAVVALMVIAASTIWGFDPSWYGRLGVPLALGRFVVVALGFLVALPFGFGLVMAGRRLARLLAEAVVPPVARGKVDHGRPPRRVLETSLELAFTLAVGIPLVGVTLPFLPPYGAPAVVLAVLVLLGVAFWRTANDLYLHARAGAELVVHVLSRQGGSDRSNSLDAVRTMLPGLGDFEPVRIEAGSAADGTTLGALNLRGRTGATVVGLVRGEERWAFPAADLGLLAGDLVALTGSRQAISEARDLVLARGTSPPPSETGATPPPAEPPSVGSGDQSP